MVVVVRGVVVELVVARGVVVVLVVARGVLVVLVVARSVVVLLVVARGVVVVVVSTRPGRRGMDSGCTQHANHTMNRWTRLQRLTRSCAGVLATCAACGANGHGRFTAAGWGSLLLAVALQFEITRPVVPHLLFLRTPAIAIVHPPRRAALLMGYLVRIHVSGFNTPDPRATSQHRQKMLLWHHCAEP